VRDRAEDGSVQTAVPPDRSHDLSASPLQRERRPHRQRELERSARSGRGHPSPRLDGRDQRLLDAGPLRQRALRQAQQGAATTHQRIEGEVHAETITIL
jgi:hypothetical protein